MVNIGKLLARAIGITLVLIMFTVARPVLAQEQESTATLEETMASIGGKLSDRLFYFLLNIPDKDGYSIRPDEKDYTTSFTVSKCTLTIDHVPASTYDNRYKLIIPFADVDPRSISVTPGRYPEELILRTPSSRQTIKFAINGQEISSSQVNVYFKDKKGNVNRLERAIKHAVKLCGGKEDPF